MNIALSIMHLYPNAEPRIDFEVRDDSDGEGQYIAVWNLTEPQPTETELLAAWDELQALPAAPTPETSDDKLSRLEAENIKLRKDVEALIARFSE